MARITAPTVERYLDSLPPERREVVAALRDLVRRNLPAGYRETMEYGMIEYGIPLERYPGTYNGKPLCYAALSAHKDHCSLHLMTAYQRGERADWLKQAFERAGKKLDMGKACVRFKSLDDLPLPAIGQFIASTSPEQFIAQYEKLRTAPRAAPATRARAAKRGAVAKKAGTRKRT
ncbi:MAG TPA: DUF1801 domain-containing protein [Gemmatimonadaceae bacterium]|nr:DUF1801 domain-containing protein [Gemmatimonadaceae bacterium]